MIIRYPLSFATILLLPIAALPQGQAVLNINDVNALFHSNGLIAEDQDTQTPHFRVPEQTDGNGPSTLFAAGLWVAGVDANGALHVAAQTYDEDGHDWFPGPLTTDGSAAISSAVSLEYDRLWSVYRTDVLRHLAYYTCLAEPGCDPQAEFPGYTIPPVFFQWPAHGDVASGQALDLAPFFDNPQGPNGADGFYDPLDGDVPCFPGDQALFTIFNDKLTAHTQSSGEAIGLEVQMMPFSYSTLMQAVDQTVFVHYRIINRGMVRLQNCYIGVYNDLDLGCSDDDFIGTDVGRNLVYVYNWDENDQSCMSGGDGYGQPPPAAGMVVLKGALLDANGSDDAPTNALPSWNGTGFGDGTIDNERTGLSRSIHISRGANANMNDPDNAAHYYNYLRSVWKDGTPLSYGGSGYSSSATATRSLYTFPGGSDPLGVGTGGVPQASWQESAQADPDRRILGSMGPFTLEEGAEQDILVAYVYARGGSRLGSVSALQQRVDSIRAFAATIPGVMAPGEPCDARSVGIAGTAHPAEAVHVFPNPATDRLTVQVPALKGPGTLRLLDATGRLVLQQAITTERTDLDVHALGAGTYAIRVDTGGTTRYQRIVVH